MAEGRRACILIACLAFAAYLPTLWGDFVYDDERFIEKNEAVTNFSANNLVRYFSDPTSQASLGHDVYRPLRTLEFAIDWAIAGDHPWFFHLRNVLYHVAACVLLYAVLRRLIDAGPALVGALAFALHPVHTESVAWITSRGDVLLLAWFLLALWLYLRERRGLAALAFAAALLSKETAVFFPVAVILVDLYRRAPRRWLWYGAYGAMAVGYVALWFGLVAEGRMANVGHLGNNLWGGSYAMTLLTMAKGFLHYARVIAFPVHFTVDYHVPASTGLGLGEVVSIVALTVIVAAAVAAGPRSRLALAWFFVALLPASNLIRPIGIPTAERFLYLPLAGVALWAGPLLARRRDVAVVVLAVMFALTVRRASTWRSDDALWHAAMEVTPTPRALDYLCWQETRAALDTQKRLAQAAPEERPALQAELRSHAQAMVRYADQLYDLYERVIRLPPRRLGGRALSRKANALVLLGRPEEALGLARRAVLDWGEAEAHFNAALAYEALGRWEDAARDLEIARRKGYEFSDLRPAIAGMWLRAAAEREKRGDLPGTIEACRRAWNAFPDPEKNRKALDALKNLGG